MVEDAQGEGAFLEASAQLREKGGRCVKRSAPDSQIGAERVTKR
jgi:hypothetical protein